MQELLNKEKRIMDIYWSVNEPYLISDILKADPSLNRNTVAKALVSLEKKGYLKVDCIKRTVTRSGRAYVPAVTKEDYKKNELLLDSIRTSTSMSQTSLAFFSCLIDQESVNDEFISKLESMIQDYKNRKE